MFVFERPIGYHAGSRTGERAKSYLIGKSDQSITHVCVCWVSLGWPLVSHFEHCVVSVSETMKLCVEVSRHFEVY